MTLTAAERAFRSLPGFVQYGLASKFAQQMTERILGGDPFGGDVGNWDQIFSRSYGSNPWVYLCTKIISQNIAQVPVQLVERQTSKGELSNVPRPDHFIQDLIDRPNAFMTHFELFFLTMAYLELTGDAFLYLPKIEFGKNVGNAGAIILMNPLRVKVNPGDGPSEPIVKSYSYRAGDYVQDLPTDDVIHLKYPNPNDDYRGQSTLDAAIDTLQEDKAAREYNKAFFKNSAIPKGALSFDRQLTTQDYKRIRSEWNAKHKGVENAHRIAIFEMGSKFQNIGLSQKEMDFILQRKLGREEIASIFQVPPILVNLYERATYNNADKQIATFWHETLIPKTELIRQSLNLNTSKFFRRRSMESDRLRFRFVLSDVYALQQEALEIAQTQIKLVEKGVRTINEVRATDSLPPVEWGDVYWRNQSLIPTTDASLALESAGKSSSGIVPSLPVPLPKKIPDAARLSAPIEVVDRFEDWRLGEWKAFVIKTDYFEKLFAGFTRKIFEDHRDSIKRRLREIGSKSALAIEYDPDDPSFSFVSAPIGEWEIEKRIGRASSLRGIVERVTKRKPIEADIEYIIGDYDFAVKYTDEAATPLYERIVEAGGKGAFTIAEIPGVFDLNDPIAQQTLLDKKQKFARKIHETTWKGLKEELAAGMERGDSIQLLADTVDDFMGDRILSSKHTIARTEVIGAMNGGLNDGLEQTGVFKTKSWSSAGDEAVRDNHITANGQTVGLKEKFSVGASKLRYPGDPDGEAKEIINCRCTIIPGKKELSRDA